MRSIPVDLILHELAARLAELPDTQHRDLHHAISRGCIRPQFLAEEWTSGAGVAQQAAWLVRRLDGEDMTAPRLREIAAETRAMEVAIARRLADCALSLLVTQDAEDAATAQTLLQAAHRVVGLAPAKPRAEEARPASATDSPEDGRWNYAQAAAKALADADAARQAEAENASKRSEERLTFTARFNSGYGGATISIDGHSVLVAGAQADALAEALRPRRAQVQRLTDDIDAWFSWAIKLAGPDMAQRSASVLRGTISARLADSKGQRLKVARDCLPSGVDIIACLHDDKPTAYKATNTDVEYDTPEAAVRAAWGHRQRPAQPVPAPAFKVGDVVRFARIHPKSDPDGSPPLGWSGTITHVGVGTFPLKVEGQRYDGDLDVPWWYFAAESLDLITPTA